jgi:hypothetical protein
VAATLTLFRCSKRKLRLNKAIHLGLKISTGSRGILSRTNFLPGRAADVRRRPFYLKPAAAMAREDRLICPPGSFANPADPAVQPSWQKYSASSQTQI